MLIDSFVKTFFIKIIFSLMDYPQWVQRVGNSTEQCELVALSSDW